MSLPFSPRNSNHCVTPPSLLLCHLFDAMSQLWSETSVKLATRSKHSRYLRRHTSSDNCNGGGGGDGGKESKVREIIRASVCGGICVSVSVCVCLCLSVSLCLSLPLSISLSLSVSLSVSLYLSLSLSMCSTWYVVFRRASSRQNS